MARSLVQCADLAHVADVPEPLNATSMWCTHVNTCTQVRACMPTHATHPNTRCSPELDAQWQAMASTYKVKHTANRPIPPWLCIAHPSPVSSLPWIHSPPPPPSAHHLCPVRHHPDLSPLPMSTPSATPQRHSTATRPPAAAPPLLVAHRPPPILLHFHPPSCPTRPSWLPSPPPSLRLPPPPAPS